MIVWEGSLAGLCLRHGYARLLGQVPQRIRGLGVDDASSSDDQRTTR